MYKWMYDRLKKEYSKESKDDLIQRILSAEEIETKDRCFAHECYAGTTIADINELFLSLEDIKTQFTYEKLNKTLELFDIANNRWKFIKSELRKIGDDTRIEKNLVNLKQRISNAQDDYDSI